MLTRSLNDLVKETSNIKGWKKKAKTTIQLYVNRKPQGDKTFRDYQQRCTQKIIILSYMLLHSGGMPTNQSLMYKMNDDLGIKLYLE